MNIDNRLYLPFPFYDSLDKQAFRQDKCAGNLHTYQILTDLRRFPPFEIRTTACSGTACSGDTWELYDTADNLIYDLDTQYNICSYIDFDVVGNVLWMQYSGVGAFDIDLPAGQYYIKVDLGDCQFYSEIVTICAMDFGFNVGAELLLNREFENWTGVGPAGDTPDDWDVNFVQAGPPGPPQNYVTESGFFCDFAAEFLTWQGPDADISQQVMTIGKNYFYDMNYSGPNGAGTPIAWVDGFAGTHPLTQSGVLVNQNGALRADDDDFHIILNTEPTGQTNTLYVCDVSLREALRAYGDNRLTLNFGNTCNLDNIYYTEGFMNRIIFQPKIDLTKPEYETTKSATPRDGYLFVKKVTTKKKYKFTFYAPEFMADAMSLLSSHDAIYITDKFGDTATVLEVNVNSTPVSNCFFKIDVELYIDPSNSTLCCS